MLEKLRQKFSSLDVLRLSCFSEEQFERYYPKTFATQVEGVLATEDKRARRDAKESLLKDVIKWSLQNIEAAKLEWEKSAAEPIQVLREIANVVLK